MKPHPACDSAIDRRHPGLCAGTRSSSRDLVGYRCGSIEVAILELGHAGGIAVALSKDQNRSCRDGCLPASLMSHSSRVWSQLASSSSAMASGCKSQTQTRGFMGFLACFRVAEPPAPRKCREEIPQIVQAAREWQRADEFSSETRKARKLDSSRGDTELALTPTRFKRPWHGCTARGLAWSAAWDPKLFHALCTFRLGRLLSDVLASPFACQKFAVAVHSQGTSSLRDVKHGRGAREPRLCGSPLTGPPRWVCGVKGRGKGGWGGFLDGNGHLQSRAPNSCRPQAQRLRCGTSIYQ